MTRTELIAQHKARLGTAAKHFTAPLDADFGRHIDAAVQALNTSRPRVVPGSAAGIARIARYAGPADMVRFHRLLWGDDRSRRQWEPSWAGTPPRVTVQWDGSGMTISLIPAPTSAQITAWGATINYLYVSTHQLTDTTNTINPADNNLLMLRASAEAMAELSNAGVVSPVQLHRGMVAIPSNSTPQAVYALLMAEYDRQAQG